MAGAPVPLSSTARTSASTRRIGGGAFGSGPELGGASFFTRSSRFAFFFKRDGNGEPAVEPRCRFSASAANNFSGKRWFRAASCNFNPATCATQQIVFSRAFAESNILAMLNINFLHPKLLIFFYFSICIDFTTHLDIYNMSKCIAKFIYLYIYKMLKRLII